LLVGKLLGAEKQKYGVHVPLGCVLSNLDLIRSTHTLRGFFMVYLTILIIRCLDLLSTKIAFDRYDAGTTIEANPVSKYLIDSLGFEWFALLNIFFSVLILYMLYQFSPLTRYTVVLFLIINCVVIGINFYATTI